MFRIVARLDVKPPNLVKGIHLEGFRKLGSPVDFSQHYYANGIDEIFYQDIVASLYERNTIGELVRETARRTFVPLSVGGGVRSIDNALGLIRGGADKVSLNTGAIRSPELVSQIARELGAQATVLCVEAKRKDNSWTAMTDCGRENTKLDAIEWVAEAADLGAGEVVATSIDRDGTGSGFDYELIAALRQATDLPLVAHGGCGRVEDLLLAFQAGADAVAIASALHYGWFSIEEAKRFMLAHGVQVRL